MNFLNSPWFNTTQTSACTLKLFYTQSIKNDKKFSQAKIPYTVKSNSNNLIKLVMKICLTSTE